MSRFSKVISAAVDGGVSTAVFLGVNGAAYYADPNLVPYTLGVGGVIYAVHMLGVMFAVMVAMIWGDFDDEEDRQELVGDLMSPGRREERHERKKNGRGKNWWDF